MAGYYPLVQLYMGAGKGEVGQWGYGGVAAQHSNLTCSSAGVVLTCC